MRPCYTQDERSGCCVKRDDLRAASGIADNVSIALVDAELSVDTGNNC